MATRRSGLYGPHVRALIPTLLLLWATPAFAGQSVVVELSGMDCAGCNKGVSAALNELPFLDGVHASFVAQGACGELVGELDEASVQAAIEGTGKTFVKLALLDECPTELRGRLPDPWEHRSEGLDVVTISHGERVDLEPAKVAGKYTIVDFGAAWCGPCHDAADVLAAYLRAHPDVAVRAVDLGGQTAEESYAAPVVAQHLEYVDGIPWLVVYGPDGKPLHKSNSVDKAVAAIDKHRDRKARKKGGS